jgi:hypothetical protein
MANVVLDILSRKHHYNNLLVQPSISSGDLEKSGFLVVPHGALNSIALIPAIKEDIILAQKVDIRMGHIQRRLGLGEVDCFQEDVGGVLWFKDLLVVPKDLELLHKIMDEAHCSRYSIHLGMNKLYQDLKKTFWWTRMKREIARYMAECDTCLRV